jgi:hypothetical protein
LTSLTVSGLLTDTSSIVVGTNGTLPTNGYNISGPGYGGAFELRTNGSTVDRGWRLGMRDSSTGFTAEVTYLDSNPNIVTFRSGITAGGTVTAAAFNATSTKRVKKAIKNISKTYMDKFADLKPREYDRKDYEAHEFGFIAEEMALIYPEIVGRDATGIPSGIDYGKLSTILTAKVQDQQKMIDKLTDQMSKVMAMLKGTK